MKTEHTAQSIFIYARQQLFGYPHVTEATPLGSSAGKEKVIEEDSRSISSLGP